MALIEQHTHQNFLELRLNRPEKRNTLTLALINELDLALDAAKTDKALAVIISGAGPAFCAGHFFEEMLSFDESAMKNLMQRCVAVMQKIHLIQKPVIASVQGSLMGAGLQLALSCDLVVASDEATFCTPGGRAGWFCSTPMIPLIRAIGRKRAFEMLFSGEPIDAKKALEWGMINSISSKPQLMFDTLKLASRVTQGSPAAKALGKELFYDLIEKDEATSYLKAAQVMADSSHTEQGRETMRAFVEKRRPVFSK